MKNKFCVKCGEPLEKDASFCGKCGTKVGEVEIEPKVEQEVVTKETIVEDKHIPNYGAYEKIDRAKLKEEAKKIYKNNMWNIWKALLIVMGISLAGTLLSSSLGVLSYLVTLFIAPLTVGEYYYLINLVSGKEFKIDQLFEFYKKNMWQIILATVLVGVFTALWCFLLIVPGIVAAISYSMVTYLYAEGSNDEATEAIKKSKLMMNGYKMDYFVLQLSFIGWFILCGLTFGILYIWILPYYMVTNILFLKKIYEIRG